MKRTGSFEYCKKVLKELNEKALEMIGGLDAEGGRGFRVFLDRMVVE